MSPLIYICVLRPTDRDGRTEETWVGLVLAPNAEAVETEKGKRRALTVARDHLYHVNPEDKDTCVLVMNETTSMHDMENSASVSRVLHEEDGWRVISMNKVG